jgi:hypothetical protein
MIKQYHQPISTHNIGTRQRAAEAQEGFRLMAEAGQSLKVILEPNTP